ncbi:MAG: LPXTG cell wall anchor domain-containing protein [Ilumatobacter sp.]
MKKLALAFTAAAAVVLGSAGVADAYPTPPPPVIDDVTPGAGEEVTVKVECMLEETVTMVFTSTIFPFGEFRSSITEVCGPAPSSGSLVNAGEAVFTFNAPTEPGSYSATATGSISGALGVISFAVSGPATTDAPTTPVGGLPATGSDGTQTMTMVAGGILVAGLAMFGVATARRRQDAAAASAAA